MSEVKSSGFNTKSLFKELLKIVLLFACLIIGSTAAVTIWADASIHQRVVLCWVLGFGYFYLTDFIAGYNRVERLLLSVMLGCIPLLLSLFLTANIEPVRKYISEHNDPNYKNEPAFLFVKGFAKRNYNTQVFAANVYDNWRSSHLVMDTGTPARANMRSNSCEIAFDADMLKIHFYEKDIDFNMWSKGVMAHELGHCLDYFRDLPQSSTDFTIGTNSIPPVQRNHVTDLQSFMDLDNPQLSLWREAMGDLFAVGFWRVNYPKDAPKLIAALQAHRNEGNASGDTIHNTSCWIKAGEAATPPTDNKAIFDWADKLRSTAKCSI